MTAKRTFWTGVTILVVTFLFCSFVAADLLYGRQRACEERGCIHTGDTVVITKFEEP